MRAFQFLEHAASAHVGVYRARQQQERDGVDVGIGHAHRRVGSARTDGGEHAAYPACDAVVRICHMRGALLVDRLHDRDLIFVIDERVEQCRVAVAGDAEEIRHLLRDQILGDDLPTGHAHGLYSFRKTWQPASRHSRAERK